MTDSDNFRTIFVLDTVDKSRRITYNIRIVCSQSAMPLRFCEEKDLPEKIFGNISAKMNDVVGRDCRNFRRSKNG